MWPFVKHEYFAVVKLESFISVVDVSSQFLKKIKKSFFWKFKKVKYYEPFTNQNKDTFVVIGTPEISPRKYSNNMAFLLELSASMRDESIKINPLEYSVKTEKYKDYTITYYKVKQ